MDEVNFDGFTGYVIDKEKLQALFDLVDRQKALIPKFDEDLSACAHEFINELHAAIDKLREGK